MMFMGCGIVEFSMSNTSGGDFQTFSKTVIDTSVSVAKQFMDSPAISFAVTARTKSFRIVGSNFFVPDNVTENKT